MFERLFLQNFKAFGERQEIHLAPITLIYGQNSAGKSSIIQALLALQQSQQSGFILPDILVSRGRWVDLGGDRQMFFQHDLSATIELGFLDHQVVPVWPAELNVAFSATDHLPEPVLTHIDRVEAEGVGWVYGYDTRDRVTKLQEARIYDRNGVLYTVSTAGDTFAERSPIRIDQLNPSWHTIYEDFTSRVVPPLKKLLEELDKFLHWYVHNLNSYRSTGDYRHAVIQVVMTDPLDDSNQISSRSRMKVLREKLTRIIAGLDTYSYEMFVADVAWFNRDVSERIPEAKEHWTRRLEVLLNSGYVRQEALRRTLFQMAFIVMGYDDDAFAELEGLHSSFIPRALDHPFGGQLIHIGPVRERIQRVSLDGDSSTHVDARGRGAVRILSRESALLLEANASLQLLELPYEIDLRVYEEEHSDSLVSLRLRDIRTNTLVSVEDVGYGVSQVLPIVIQSVAAQDKIIMIEQPELHLHPRQQASLASLFAQSFLLGSNQFIIETHSENLLLRLQRLVREGQLSHDQVCVLYVDRDQHGSHVMRLPLNAHGRFEARWPGGFFEEGYNERFDLTPLPELPHDR